MKIDWPKISMSRLVNLAALSGFLLAIVALHYDILKLENKLDFFERGEGPFINVINELNAQRQSFRATINNAILSKHFSIPDGLDLLARFGVTPQDVALLHESATSPPQDFTIFTPPPLPGTIYAVIEKRDKKQQIAISVKWGEFERTKSISLSAEKGILLQLGHWNADSYDLVLKTTGVIRKGPMQDRYPDVKELYLYSHVRW